MDLERFTRKPVITAGRHEATFEVARKMFAGHVGAVVIVEGGAPIGIVTDRDIALRVVAAEADPREAIGRYMSEDPITARVDESLDVALARMHQRAVRRLPIVDAAGRLCGMLALDDVLVRLAGETAQVAGAVAADRGP